MDFIQFIAYFSAYIGLIATSFFILSYIEDKKKGRELYSDEELPTVTVIIPIFNEEKSIQRTLKSILSSDYPKGKLDVLMVDDASTDNSLEIAKSFVGEHNGIKVRVIAHKKNKGCGEAHNTGIRFAKGEIIQSMDADTFVEPHSLKEMMRRFKNPKVMCVCPAMIIYKPKGIFQKIQAAEYLLGLFLRRAFLSLNSIYVTPGAFSAYRKSFFEKYGGYSENNLTEDLELTLRIQSNGYDVEYCPNAPAYTIAPNKFGELLKQRRRWYVGLMRNTRNYLHMFSKKYGDLGTFVLPIAWVSIFLAVLMINYFIVKGLLEFRDNVLFLSSVNFDFLTVYGFHKYYLETLLFNIFSNPIFIFIFFFLFVSLFYLLFAAKNVGKQKGIISMVVFYYIFFALMFGFFWTISIIYTLFNRKVSWR